MPRGIPNARAAEPASPAVHTSNKSSGTVTVACKIPHGLILQLCKEIEVVEDTQGGPRTRKRWDKFGERIMIRGNSYPVSPKPGFPERCPTADGYALTFNVSADFFEEWIKQNRRNPVVTGNLIYALPKTADVRAKAAEQKEIRSGLEPLDIEGNDPRIPKPTNSAVSAVTKASLDDLGA